LKINYRFIGYML